MRMVEDAIAFATRRHAGQWLEGECPLPYILHPLEVLMRLRYEGGVTDEELLATAVLHDVVEQAGAKPSSVRKRFGSRVADLVMELTRKEPDPSLVEALSKDQLWELRANLLLSEIAAMSPDAQKVKLADRRCNLELAIAGKKNAKLERYVWQTRRILGTIPCERLPGIWLRIDERLAPFEAR
jgi:(p)ppGpp synthase/HD superfamily hydrolase